LAKISKYNFRKFDVSTECHGSRLPKLLKETTNRLDEGTEEVFEAVTGLMRPEQADTWPYSETAVP
jgi:hypothetical protein